MRIDMEKVRKRAMRKIKEDNTNEEPKDSEPIEEVEKIENEEPIEEIERGEEMTTDDNDLDALIDDLENGKYEVKDNEMEEEEETEEEKNNKEDMEEEEETEEIDITPDKTKAILSLIVLSYVLFRMKDMYESYNITDEVEKTKEFEKIAERLQKQFEILAMRSKMFRKLYSNADELLIFVDVLALVNIVELKIKERKGMPTATTPQPMEEPPEQIQNEPLNPALQKIQIGY